jgi:hypothetical protein
MELKMLFSIDQDVGGRLEGWVMPDNPATTPRVIVRLNAEHHIVVEAFVFRPLLKEYGLHNTGICGFVLDNDNCPGLIGAGELEIYDADNNLLIYRRKPSDGLIEKKFFRLEPQLFRSVTLDELLTPRFHMTYVALDLLPEETTRSILAIAFSSSIYAEGRIFWRVWEPLLRDRGYRVGMLLRDPYHELAERLLILKLATSPQRGSILDALGPIVEAAAAHMRDVDLKGGVGLEEVLGAPPHELRSVLYNPLTYLLTAQNAFDAPPTPATAVALDSLADMDAIGLRDDTKPFLETVSAVLDLPENFASPALSTSEPVLALADVLRETPVARRLIEMDLDIYQTVATTLDNLCGQQTAISA